jgi:hypothetical protein
MGRQVPQEKKRNLMKRRLIFEERATDFNLPTAESTTT